ncbi:MAG: diguanylate cyclase, partial [Actinomycetota bacterium]|nr:diguanylate cyclase [Actinomycetota bacterium]
VVSITSLRAHADRARQAQVAVSEIDTDAQHVSRIEWQAAAQRGVARGLRDEFLRVHAHMDSRLEGFTRRHPAQGHRLYSQAHVYLAAIQTELALLDRAKVAESRRVDARTVDPAFARLQHQLGLLDADQGKDARTAAHRADLGVIGSLLLAAMAVIALFWRLDTVRHVAVRARNKDLEVQALSDALTGLPNRRKLEIDLARAVQQADAGEPSALILCDLDGFKTYNDTFGHLEGDLLLGRLGTKLAQTVAPHGIAYRLGGDEFCALLRLDDQELQSTLRACHAALSESGTGFEVRASIGCVSLPEEASTASIALRLADQRMYAEKSETGSSARQQTRDIILRVLEEQDPELHAHVQDVALLAGGVGRRLGLNAAQVVSLVRAAELHDVGKVAIPDSILNKPGPLDPGEMKFLRRHTLIGESILSAAPALGGIGRLVRSSHERYDGTGYPDGLRGEDIPLISRVIFVCDSFDAMTTARAYRPAMNEHDAVAVLRHCAGTQFDPAVIDAFVGELAARNTARLRSARETPAPEPSPAA